VVSFPFSDLVGQTQAVTLLRRAVVLQRIAPGYLFVGPNGTGKSLAATGFAELLLSAGSTPPSDPMTPSDPVLMRRIRDRNHPDLLWVEPTYLHNGQLLTPSQAAESGVKRKSPPRIRLPQIRDIARFLSRPALESARTVVVIEQAERMAEAAANALLKTLEEPGKATLILLAPDQQTLLPTLISRCQSVAFRRLSHEHMAQVLTTTGHPEILQSDEVMAIAQGSPGRAIESWAQLQTMPPDLLSRLARPPTTLREALEMARDISQALDTEIQLWLIDYLQHRYWHTDYWHTDYCQTGTSGAPNAADLKSSDAIAILEKARSYLLSFVQPRLAWEITLSQMAQRSVR
jgi:DNA polymerase III subunit delta'